MAGITAAQTVMAVAAMPAVMTLQGRLHRSAGTWHGRQCAPVGHHDGRRRSTFRRDRARRLADGSDWAKVIPLLQAKGVKVQAVQNGLNSLADDVAATRRAIGNQPGKVVVVGHSWGGTVITEAGADSKVAGLVYVAAFAPDAGQSTEEVDKDYAPAPGIGKLVADANGYLSLPPAELASDFAQDVPRRAGTRDGRDARSHQGHGIWRAHHGGGMAKQAVVVHRQRARQDDPAGSGTRHGPEDWRQGDDTADEPRAAAVAAARCGKGDSGCGARG